MIKMQYHWRSNGLCSLGSEMESRQELRKGLGLHGEKPREMILADSIDYMIVMI